MKQYIIFAFFLISFINSAECGILYSVGGKVIDDVGGLVKSALILPDFLVTEIIEGLLPEKIKIFIKLVKGKYKTQIKKSHNNYYY